MQGEKFNACTAPSPVFKAPKTSDPDPGLKPVSLGPFNGGGYEGCVFTDTNGRVDGVLTCNDNKAVDCVQDTAPEVFCKDGRSWFSVSDCTL